MWLRRPEHGAVCVAPEMTARPGYPSNSVYLSQHSGQVFPLSKEQASQDTWLACQRAADQSWACSANGSWPNHHSPTHFSAVLSRSLIVLSSLSSFAISTAGPISTFWPFFACKKSKWGREVSREDHGDGERSSAGRAVGLLHPSSQSLLIHSPWGLICRRTHLPVPVFQSQGAMRCVKVPHGLGKVYKEGFGWGWEWIHRNTNPLLPLSSQPFSTLWDWTAL